MNAEVWVLVETVASKRQGRALFYAGMSAIGPMTTKHSDEAVFYASEAAAAASPVASFALAVFKPRRLADALADPAYGAEATP